MHLSALCCPTLGSQLRESGGIWFCIWETRLSPPPPKLLLFLHSWEGDGIFLSVCGQCTLTDFPGIPRQFPGNGLLTADDSLPWVPTLANIVEVETPRGAGSVGLL